MDKRDMQQELALMTQLAQLGNGAHAFAMRIVGSSADAADAVHDAFATALRKPEAFDPGKGSLRAWFLGIVRFRCLDLLRQRRALSDDVDSLAGEEPGPEELAERSENETRLQRALNSLHRDQQEIIILRDFMDLSYIEIAQTLELPAGTVMSRLHRARLALKEAFESK